MLTAASVCLAVVVLDRAWVNLWATVPVLLVGGADHRGVPGLHPPDPALRLVGTPLRLQPDAGHANLEPSSMSLEVLSQVCTVMRARRAQLVLAEPSGIPRRVSLDERGPSGVEPISLEESSFVSQVIRTGRGVPPQEHRHPAAQDLHRPDRRRVRLRHRGPAHERELGDRRHRRLGSRRGARHLRRRRSPPLRGPRRTRQRQPGACPPGRGTALRGRQQVTPGDPRHADRAAQPHAVPHPGDDRTEQERRRRHRAARPRPVQGRQRHARPRHRRPPPVRGLRAAVARRLGAVPPWPGSVATSSHWSSPGSPTRHKPSPRSTICTTRCRARSRSTG